MKKKSKVQSKNQVNSPQKTKFRDKKHRILATQILLSSLAFAAFIFFFMRNSVSDEIAATWAFAAGVSLNVLYHFFYLEYMEHNLSKINSLTQVWLGIIIVISSIITIILNTLFNVEFSTAVIWMSGIVLLLMFTTIKKFDVYLEHKIN